MLRSVNWLCFMLPRSALQAVTLLTSLSICAIIWTSSNSTATKRKPIFVYEKHGRSWRGSSKVDPSPTSTTNLRSATNANEESGSTYAILNATHHAPSPGTQNFAQARQAQAQDGISRRCKHTLGEWCTQALSVNRAAAATPDSPGGRICTAACNIVGNCNADTGVCDCPAGKPASLPYELCRTFIAGYRCSHFTLPGCHLHRHGISAYIG